MTPAALWAWLLPGYLFTVAIEAPILLLGLGKQHPWQRRVLAALWLTAVTYPIVVVALPLVLWPRTSYGTYVVVAELFAVGTECVLFRQAFGGTTRDVVIVGLANVASAAAGLAWFGVP